MAGDTVPIGQKLGETQPQTTSKTQKFVNSAPTPGSNDTRFPGIPTTLTSSPTPKITGYHVQKELAPSPRPDPNNGGFTGDRDATSRTPNSSDGNSGTDDDGFTVVTHRKKKSKITPDLVKSKQHLFGVVLARTCKKSSHIPIEDIQNLFTIIASFDSEAILVASNKDLTNAHWASQLGSNATDNLNDFLNLRTTSWGRWIDNHQRTTLSFYLASNTISSVTTLKGKSLIKQYLQNGHCTMNVTYLHESRAKLLGFFQGKDPKHTHRNDILQRISAHLQKHAQAQTPIPLHVITTTEQGTNILGLLVGSTDAPAVEEILATDPFPDVQVILKSWSRSDPDQ